jgi:uncharacterized protein YfbU (UPF0304 family)
MKTNFNVIILPGLRRKQQTDRMGFCRCIIEIQGKSQEQKAYLLKNDNLDSHMPMTNTYERMLAK